MSKFMMISISLLALLYASTTLAQQAAEQIQVNDPYVRAVPPGQTNSASFMTLTNGDSQEHALVGAQSPASKVVELHTHTMVDGMMRMRPVEKIGLPAGEQVALQPGGLHVMLIGLQQNLTPGEEIPITLIFEDGSKQEITAPVRKLQMHMKHMHRMDHSDHMQH